MPNRILRDWTDSDSVNTLSCQAERHFVRIIQKADDFGRLNANPKLLRPMLYPLLLEQVREADVQRWTAECEKAGLVRLYSVGGKEYMEVLKFEQRLRAKRSKYPKPPGPLTYRRQPHDGHVSDIRRLESEAEALVGGERRESLAEALNVNEETTKATTLRSEGGNQPPVRVSSSRLVEEAVVYLDDAKSRDFYALMERRLGGGLFAEAFGDLKMRVREGTVRDRRRYFTKLLKSYAETQATRNKNGLV